MNTLLLLSFVGLPAGRYTDTRTAPGCLATNQAGALGSRPRKSNVAVCSDCAVSRQADAPVSRRRTGGTQTSPARPRGCHRSMRVPTVASVRRDARSYAVAELDSRVVRTQIIDSSQGSAVGRSLIACNQSPDVSLSGAGRSISAIASESSRDCLISAANAGPVVAGSSSARATTACNATRSWRRSPDRAAAVTDTGVTF